MVINISGGIEAYKFYAMVCRSVDDDDNWTLWNIFFFFKKKRTIDGKQKQSNKHWMTNEIVFRLENINWKKRTQTFVTNRCGIIWSFVLLAQNANKLSSCAFNKNTIINQTSSFLILEAAIMRHKGVTPNNTNITKNVQQQQLGSATR